MNGLRRNDDEAKAEAGIPNSPLVSIVLLNWNGKDWLRQFLPFVLASTYVNKRVVVVDNASTDGSVAFLQQAFPEVEVLVHETNEGFAKGYNSALRQLASDYYVLLNTDVEVTPGWIEPVIALMEADPGIAACQPKIMDQRRRSFFEYAGACGGWLDRFGYPFARGRVFETLEEDRGQYDNAEPCFWASGAALFVRAQVFHEVKGLDEYFFAHQEEIDFCWRLQLSGYKVFVQPASLVYHVGGGTLPQGNRLKSFLNFRNNLVMLAKNLPGGKALLTISGRLLLDALAAWKGLLGGDAGFFTAVLKAHVFFFKWVFFDRRKSVFPIKKQGPTAGWYQGSVVWAYFIKKKKCFSEIVKGK